MNCTEAEQLFDAYLDGELAGSLRLEFDAHRLRCRLCQQKLAMMEACEHIVGRDAQMPTPSRNFTDQVMRQIEQRQPSMPRTRSRWSVAAYAVGLQAAAVIVFALLWWANASSPQTQLASDTRGDFIEKVGEAIEHKDKVELLELIFARSDQLLAGGDLKDFGKELRGFARCATNLSVLGDLPATGDVTPSSPLGGLMNFLVPTAPARAEPAPSTTGSFSL